VRTTDEDGGVPVGAGVGGGAGAVVASAVDVVVVSFARDVEATSVSCRADHKAADRTAMTAQSRRIRRTSTASVWPVDRR
jgi:hypothetical protein